MVRIDPKLAALNAEVAQVAAVVAPRVEREERVSRDRVRVSRSDSGTVKDLPANANAAEASAHAVRQAFAAQPDFAFALQGHLEPESVQRLLAS